MRRWWLWTGVAAAALVLVGSASAVVLARTPNGQRAVRYVQRKYGWGEVGRQAKAQARFQSLMGQARSEFTFRQKNNLCRVEYPTKATLLQEFTPQIIALENTWLGSLPYDRREVCFELDLLLTADPDAMKARLGNMVADGQGLWIPGVMDAVSSAFTVDERKQMALSSQGYSSDQLLWSLGPALDQPFLEQFILTHPEQISTTMLDRPEGMAAVVAVYPQLPRTGKLAYVQSMTYRRDQPDWKALLAKETDPAVRQAMLFAMGDTEGLLAALEKDGFFPRSLWYNWEWERRTAVQQPNSFLAKGIKAYEAVRGEPYFDLDRRQQGMTEWEHGNRYYHPATEIPGWLSYLKTYSKHEGADDAAYRLGRCYEITGQYAEALRWLYAASDLGDGEMGGHAKNRVIWILDALLDEQQLRALPVQDLPDPLQPMVAYSIALRELRSGQYSQAVQDLDALRAKWDGKALPVGGWITGYPFWSKVQEQRALADRLAQLAAEGTPQAQYDLAATMYHNELLFYSYLWGGGRQGYYFEAEQALAGDMDPAYTRWAAESNNLIQAAAQFERLADAPAPIAEKAAYSRALALVKLLDYGRDVALWRPFPEIAKAGDKALTEFLARFPQGELAPDAMLTLAYLREDPALFQQIVRDYPKSNAAVTARSPGLDERSRGRGYYSILPFRYVRAEEAPADVAAKARALAGVGGTEKVTLGDWTYLVVGVPRQDLRVDLSLFDDGGIRVGVAIHPGEKGEGYAIARIPATSRWIEFNPLPPIR
ncbi:MAG: tetratricopeptide repeat protein [Mycobacterium leprae]